ncbi:leucyl aminopeptidase [Clostridium sp. 'deep sea']|uniref:leucyl aminopeptidase n=1 Tax=Clostridium sp. 'deep sea' TaxID=2779445 RepID=UPI001896537C|nr:leucyl aminopeptidase [Clostridium sp. 'deep sea']QOR33893.1 leucyl aminopeptidase [Clostridium sp. 'deep sea']
MDIKLITHETMPKSVDTTALFWFKDQKIETLQQCEATKVAKYLIEQEQFSGKSGEICATILPNTANTINKIILVGLGEKEKVTREKVRTATGKIIKKAKELKTKELMLCMLPDILDIDEANTIKLIAETISLATYKFTKFKTKKQEPKIQSIYINSSDSNFETALNEGLILAETTNIARDLTADPANVLTPVELAKRAEKYGKEYGFKTEIFEEKKIQELGMQAYYAVAKGSDDPPRFIIMRYNGNPANSEDITALVGKGLCYDSGGLSLKQTKGMAMMKTDMAGSAAVIGAMCAIAKQKLKVNVVGIVAACENILSAKSYKPGDIINSLGGKTIHIGNTDAEGRLTLIDAVYYAVTAEKATRVLDIATLTGACVAALGSRVSGVLASDDDFYNRLAKASEITGELIWRLPTFDKYKKAIEHPEADLNNIGEGGAGTITAGLFIGEFTEGKPWIHMDIAGDAYAKADLGYIAKGPTGVGVRNLYYLVKSYC